MDTDRIEKQILLAAPLARVWRAISDAPEFGLWFGVRFAGPFVEGARLTGRIAPMTLVTFALAEEAGGTRLTITEEGFDGIPLARRAQAFTANDGGWAKQTTLIEKYLRRQAGA
jgi:uncharacterized protein YndB with AHSA1/START domain